MANIFLTGVSATYASPKASDKSLNLAGALNRVLTSVGDEVTWASPSVFMDKEDFNKYDSVLVGISALTSLSSDRAYGALNVINKLWGSEKLVIFVDTPNPSQIEVSLNSYILNPDTLTKSFFSFRKDYSNVVSDQTLRDSVMSGISLLKNEEWGTTIYPKLPWRQPSDIESMSVERRQIVAMAQKESYLSYIPSEEKAVYQINELLNKKEPTWVK
jgi:hypothetical protein